jgi:hypothetical protein
MLLFASWFSPLIVVAFLRRQHAQQWRDEIDSKGMPVAGVQCGAERPGRIRAHTG